MADINKPKYGVPKVPLPPDVRKPSGLAQRIEDSITRILVGIFNIFTKPIVQTSNAMAQFVLDTLEGQGIAVSKSFIDDINANPVVPQKYKDMVNEAVKGEHAFPIIILIAIVSAVAVGLVMVVVGPFLQRATLWINKEAETSRPTIQDLVRMRWKGVISSKEFDTWCAETGWSAELVKAYLGYMQPLLDINTLIEAKHRNLISPGHLTEQLTKRGYSQDTISLIDDLAHLLPSPQDFITFAVREAFNQKVVDMFGYDEDTPGEFLSFMQELGYDEIIARYFWRSHWRLPSADMGAAMLHRGIIETEEYDTLLKALDYPPFWRNAVRKLTYSLLTRVDVRRMYKEGIIPSFEELVETYEKQGYSEEDAIKLAELAESTITNPDRDLTKSDILGAYNDGIIARNTALDMLMSLAYDRDESDILLSRIDYKRTQIQYKAVLKLAERLYKRGEIDSNEVLARTGKFNVPPGQVALLIDIWDVDRQAKDRLPTLAQLIQFFKLGIIDEAIFGAECRMLNYSDKYISWFMMQARIKGTELESVLPE